MDDKRLTKIERIGSGTYGTVYKCKDTETGKIVAVKEIRLENPEEGVPATALREISLLKKLIHPNIVELIDIDFSEKKIVLIFEFLDADLKKYLDVNKGKLDKETIRLFLYQLLAGTAYCHHHRVLHRDLKPQNLLINFKTKILKLADFGLARAFGNTMRRYSHEVVTLWYRSPDVLLGSTTYPATIDIWSAGCIFAEMITGKALFPGKSSANQLETIFRKMGTPDPEDWPGVTELPEWKSTLPKYKPTPLEELVPGSDELGYDLLRQMLLYDPEKRISAVKALEHAYFKDFKPEAYGLDYSKVDKKKIKSPIGPGK